MSNYEIRAKARQDLGNSIFSNSWMISLVVYLLVGLILGACSSILPGIGAIIVTGPLYVGMAKYFLLLSREPAEAKLETSFSGFNDFGANLLIGLMSGLFVFLWSLLLIVPGIIKAYAYSMAFYIKNDNPTYDWKQCLDESQRMMTGNKGKLFLLDLSFIGWILLGALCCGIGTLWVSPYIESARANFYEDIKNND